MPAAGTRRAERRLGEPDEADQAQKQEADSPEHFGGGDHGALRVDLVLHIAVSAVARNTEIVQAMDVIQRGAAAAGEAFRQPHLVCLGAPIPHRNDDGGAQAARDGAEEVRQA